ncbi:MAG TPA: response regulator transcription factor [Pirellulales bacterium]|nr:response regulator transcription factor [Pirellulales bacterium]
MTPAAARILIVEDEHAMRVALRDILDSEGYRVQTAPDGLAGLQLAVEEKPDLILLDVMMPKLDGYALCAELRRLAIRTPVLMVTAKGQVADRVTGLDSGADDYLIKPFSTEELLARVRALLRRSQGNRRVPRGITMGDVRIDLVKMTAHKGHEPVALSAREFAMLRLLAEAEGEPVSRQRFLDLVWGATAFPTTRTVDNHVVGLRSKVEEDAKNPRWIVTVHGVGYRLEGAQCDFSEQ